MPVLTAIPVVVAMLVPLALTNNSVSNGMLFVTFVLAVAGSIYGIKYKTSYASEKGAREAAESYSNTQRERAEEAERELRVYREKLDKVLAEIVELKKRDVSALFEAFIKHDSETRSIASETVTVLRELSTALSRHMEKSKAGEVALMNGVAEMGKQLGLITQGVQIVATTKMMKDMEESQGA